MAITVDWPNKVVQVPKADLAVIQSTPFEIRELDIEAFHLELRAIEADFEGMPYPRIHDHVAELTLSGQVYARAVEIVNGYTVEFEDGQYGVSATNGNNNVLDVKVANQVSYSPNNSAGALIVETGTSGLTPAESQILSDLLALMRAGRRTPDGKVELYDELDNLIFEADAFEDVAGTTPHTGGAIRRHDHLDPPA